MENNNSEKTGRLTPGQMQKVIELSTEISKIDVIDDTVLRGDLRQKVIFCPSPNEIIVQSWSHWNHAPEMVTHHRTIIDDDFFEMLKNYFTEKRSRLESKIENAIYGEGGER